MSLESAQRQPNFADVFERVLVPAIFERYARDLIERARPIGAADRILDLGCGTGIVARVLRQRLGGAASIVGVDVNAAMLAKARSLAPELEFREGSATALPFPDGAFDLVLAQQVLQFVTDKAAAVREMRRVLSPRGRLIASTWRPRSEQPLHDTLGRIAERHLGPSKDARFALGGATLAELLAQAGFTDVRVDTASLVEHFHEFPVRLSAMAGGFDLSALTDEERERRFAALETESRAALTRFAREGGFAARSITSVVSASAPRAA